MQSERPVTGGPGPLIELLYLIGEKDAQNEAKVLLREPRRQSRGRQAMLDARIAAFCSSACSVPFAFTVLAAVLPQEEDGDGTSPDPTDFLYCTALRFVEAGQKRALCVVSRHPFVEAFGKLLQLLRDGQEALETEVDDAELQGDEGSGGSHTMSNKSSLGAGVNAEVPDEAGEDPSLQRLRRAARRLRHVAPKTRREATRRSRTVPVNQAALEKMPPSPLESRRSYPAKPPALKQEGEDAKLSLENFSYPALSWGPRMGCQEDRRKKAVLLEWAAAQVFRHFTLQDVWELVLALLLEFRIVVVSEAPELASQLVLGLTALLWPFGWQHLLLPICPPYLQGAILDAPVPFICALPAVTSQVATASTAAFTAPRGLGVGAQQGVVVCDADMGVVSLPPGSTTFLRPQLATLQMDANLDASKLLDDTSGAMPRVLKIQKKLMALAEQLSEAHQEVTEDLGSAKWMQEVQAKLSPEPEPFLQAFVNSETCLMFLAVD